ncbi:hypothetical protein [Streptosporangium sp. NPDC006930]|uniref:hypothetical protein n=1 Tax=unclassified Streptosporangium TaxID=2632669 RepID=UPI0034379838
MTIGNTVMLVIVALFVMVGLTVSLIAITLTSIKETGGRIPQWPVSWPEPPLTLSQQKPDTASGPASLPSQRVTTLPLRQVGESARQVSLPQQVEIPRQRVAPSRPADVPPQRVSPLS